MKYRHMYDKSVHSILEKLLYTSQPNHLTYVAELKGDRVIHKMDHLACFLGGTLALGAYSHPEGLESAIAQRQLTTGKQLAYTCYQLYARSKSGLAPEFVRFDNTNDDFATGSAPYYILRPETVETFYILYHFTKDPIYREWGWEIFQAIEEHCKTDAGYAAIQNVDTIEQNNRMESFFLAETLKYLFLLQDDTNDFDLLNTVSETIVLTFSFAHIRHLQPIVCGDLLYFRNASTCSIQKRTHFDFYFSSRVVEKHVICPSIHNIIMHVFLLADHSPLWSGV